MAECTALTGSGARAAQECCEHAFGLCQITAAKQVQVIEHMIKIVKPLAYPVAIVEW